MKGIILAGGAGSRLYPLTSVVNKQLLPVYDKPMIYYPLATLMAAGIREVLIITSPKYLESYKQMLGNGSNFGISIQYESQSRPNGIVEAFLIGKSFIGEENVALILGDNIFHGSGLGRKLEAFTASNGANIFAYRVSNPEEYGVIEFDKDFNILSLEEKPSNPKSNYAIPGLYFFEPSVKEAAREVEKSNRGELEILSLLRIYYDSKNLSVTLLPRGTVWLDTGSPKALSDASMFVQIIEERQGHKIACLEELAWRLGWITELKLRNLADSYPNSSYKAYLIKLLDQPIGKNW
jgi:glucose-1-phosphate thymidylyltransferase